MQTESNVSMYEYSNYFYFFDIKNYYKRIYQNFDMNFHRHNGIVEIMYINYGEIDVIYTDPNTGMPTTTTISTGEYIVIDSGIEHKISVGDKKSQILNIELIFSKPVPPLDLSVKTLIDNSPDVYHFFSEKKRIFTLSDTSNVGPQITMIIKYLLSGENPENTESKRSLPMDFYIAALISQIAENYIRENYMPNFSGVKYLRTAIKFIAEKYSHPISVKEVAEIAGVSQNYLNKLFNEKFTMSINEYINHVRIFKAKLLLEKTNMSVSDLALQVGYNNKQNFNKNFIKAVGLTPRSYKKYIGAKDNFHWED